MTEVGVIPLKGKSNGVFVYSVDEVFIIRITHDFYCFANFYYNIVLL